MLVESSQRSTNLRFVDLERLSISMLLVWKRIFFFSWRANVHAKNLKRCSVWSPIVFVRTAKTGALENANQMRKQRLWCFLIAYQRFLARFSLTSSQASEINWPWSHGRKPHRNIVGNVLAWTGKHSHASEVETLRKCLATFYTKAHLPGLSALLELSQPPAYIQKFTIENAW